MSTRLLSFCFVASLAFGAPGIALAQGGAALDVQVSLPSGRLLRSDEPLRILLSRPIQRSTERLAVMIGETDWTGVLREETGALVYEPGPVRLPTGSSTLDVYLVSGENSWTRLASAALQIATPLGFERASVTPRISVTNQGQIAEHHSPESNAPARDRFQDLAVAFGLRTEHVRGGLTFDTQTNLQAVTRREQAVQFGQRGDDARKLDITDYVWRLKTSTRELTVGHTAFAVSRHLMPALPTRGLSFTGRGDRVDVTLASASATSIVGVSNLFGVSEGDNRVSMAVLGVDLSERDGGARVEASLLKGARATAVGFTQGAVSDRETSRGAGVRFVGSDPGGWLRVDGSFATSRSGNPDDPLLDQGLTVVGVRDRSSRAQFLETAVTVLRNPRAARGAGVAVNTAYRFERVDPFFRSVGAAQGVRSDVLQQTIEASGSVGAVMASVTRSWSHDNLDGLPSILTTDSTLTTATFQVPSGGARPSAPTPWWPSVSYSTSLSGQAGRAAPPNSGFTSASHVPDQRNTTHTVRADWTVRQWRANYSLNRSAQDNRQDGRQNADFLNLVHQIAIGLASSRLDLSSEFSRERATSKEFSDVTRTTRLGGTATWRLDVHNAVNGLVSRSAMNGTTTGENTITNVTLQYTYSHALRGLRRAGPSFQLYGRSSWQSGRTLSPFVVGLQEQSLWTMETGAVFNLF